MISSREGGIAERLERIRERIEAAATRAGRTDAVTLVAVTKTVPLDAIQEAFVAGQRVFGENRVQEGTAKMARLQGALPGTRWHLIGHLQTNKARSAVEAFDLIESVDSERLAVRLNALADERGTRLPVLLEVNVSGEEAKSGFQVKEFERTFDSLLQLSWLELRGLMTVAPLTGQPEEVRPIFRRLRELRDQQRERHGVSGLKELSMGMTNDFEVAIEEGATMVRIGRALFGERSPAPGPG